MYIKLLILISIQLLDALELSRLTIKTVKQNLWWAFAYNIVSPFAGESSFLFLFYSVPQETVLNSDFIDISHLFSSIIQLDIYCMKFDPRKEFGSIMA